MHEEPRMNRRQQLANVAAVLMLLCRSFAVTAEVFLHDRRTFGERYPGGPGALAVLILLFWPTFFAQHADSAMVSEISTGLSARFDSGPMLWLLGLYLLRCLMIRVSTAARIRRGSDGTHSRYTGTPLLLRLLPRKTELRIKSGTEPMLLFLVGLALTPVNVPLSTYVLCCSLGLGVSVGQAMHAERRKAQEMYDAYLDQRGVMDQFRSMRGE